jgi:hypothetical protein
MSQGAANSVPPPDARMHGQKSSTSGPVESLTADVGLIYCTHEQISVGVRMGLGAEGAARCSLTIWLPFSAKDMTLRGDMLRRRRAVATGREARRVGRLEGWEGAKSQVALTLKLPKPPMQHATQKYKSTCDSEARRKE